MTRAEFESAYDAHVDLVRSVLVRLCPMREAGRLDDLTQEVFLRAWRARDAFRRQSSVKTWLCRIARNLSVDELRARGSGIQAEMPETPDALLALDALPAPGVDPQDRALLLDSLARLTPDDRLLLVLTVVEGQSLAEVAEVLEIPVGTVKSRAFTLRQKLKADLEPAAPLRKEAIS